MAGQIIDSYYASYSLEYYEVGKVYSFYARKSINHRSAKDIPANDDITKQYARAFRGLEDDTEQYAPPGAFANLIRFYGVVVDKIPGDGNGSHDKIIVMVHQPSSDDKKPEYFLRAYVVNYQGIWADGREILGAQASVEPGSFMQEQEFLDKYDYAEKPIAPSGDRGKGPEHQPITKGGGGPQHQPVTVKGGKGSKGSKPGEEKSDQVTGVVTKIKKDDSDTETHKSVTKNDDEEIDQITGVVTKIKKDDPDPGAHGVVTKISE